MRIAITGATGYIGQSLTRAALQAGHQVLALSRQQPLVHDALEWQSYDLADSRPLTLPDDIDVIFHLAAETHQSYGTQPIELGAAQRLIDASRAVDAMVVFISSQTARVDAPTQYGRIKWQIERMMLEANGRVIRPGLVYGGPERGLFGLLCSLVRRLPILPAFIPAPLVQPVHVDDLAQALLACLTTSQPPLICIGAPDPMGFTAVLYAIARGRTGRRPISIPVPTLLLWGVANIAGARLSARLGLDRLVSLFTLPQMGTVDDLARLSLQLRPFSAGVTRSGMGDRYILREGRTMLNYVLRISPSNALVRRYARFIGRLRMGRALGLPEIVLCLPLLLSLLEGVQTVDAEFRDELDLRLNVALMLAEASPQGAHRFLGTGRRTSLLLGAVSLMLPVMKDVIRRMVQLMFRPILVRIGFRGALS